ncbi:hypothetical protein J4U07_06590, partial [Escherichia coli]
ILCFFINSASSRNNKQIGLLEEWLDQQKRQNERLSRLWKRNRRGKENKKTVESQK